MLKIGVVFGGMSTEHDVSVVSGTSIIRNLDQTKYEIYPIYITKEGIWEEYQGKIEDIPAMEVGDQLGNTKPIDQVMTYLKQMDCLFPALHGLYGEDGTIQGMFEMLKIPYVGPKVLASSVSMDKAYTKIILDRAGIKQTPYAYLRKYKDQYIDVDEHFNEVRYDLETVSQKIDQQLTYPMFIKPSNSGSSVGIQKAKNLEQLKQAILYAGEFDQKILVEQGVIGREIECAVLGNEDVEASCIGEVFSAEEFYSFDSKYKNSQSMTKIPAEVSKEKSDEIRDIAIKAFKAVNGSGLSRVDFFIEKNTEEVYINEINTMPGFTRISMYPKLFEAVGVSYSQLLDRMIALALEK